MSFTLPVLPYTFNALEQAIDAQTVEIHYTKHHTAYLNNLNAALEKYPQFFNHPIEHILADLNQVPEEIRTAVRNNGGGYYNHILYWNGFSPDGGGEHTHKSCDVCNGPAMALPTSAVPALAMAHGVLAPPAERFASTEPHRGIKPPIS